MKINIDQIDTFIMLSKYRNFSKVADLKYITQSSISKQIKSLEMELDVKLFERKNQLNSLTPEGELFVPFAQKIVENYQEGLKALEVHRNNEKNELRIGTTSLFGSFVVPNIMSEYKNLYPHTKFKIVIDSSKAVLEKLENKEIDIAFISDYIPFDSQAYDCDIFKRDSLILIVPNNHPFVKQEEITLQSFVDETFIIKSKESSLFKFLIKKLKEQNSAIQFDDVIEINNQNSIVQAVSLGLGISIVSEMLLDNEEIPAHVHAVKLENFDLFREVCYVYPKVLPTPTVKTFINYLKPE
ncbi:LysR substrate-binding domain-containing protein [Vagococcus fluvialis]|uniref:LysR substrate-binding domain-containing protein n=1 Tax=Vagococcus fluvialis TaxID=2738 RepID=UPI003B20E0E1